MPSISTSISSLGASWTLSRQQDQIPKKRRCGNRPDRNFASGDNEKKQRAQKIRLLQARLRKMKVTQNRNSSSIAQEAMRQEKRNISERKARTRTLIQCGGLLSLSGLVDLCGIIEGEDLQQDIEAYEKAATLLGILCDAREKIANEDQLQKFRKFGKTILKKSAAKSFYH